MQPEETGDLVYAENDTFSNFNCFKAVNGFCSHDKNVQQKNTHFRYSTSTMEKCAIKIIIWFLHRDIMLHNES